MKISLNHVNNHLRSPVDISELSEKLFQLGHEHEIENEIFDFEFTPNRGDCLSLTGLLQDLKVFYELDPKFEIYNGEIDKFDFNFENKSPESCSRISFLKIKVENDILEYKSYLKDYFEDFGIKKNNFFTDISNYISYETGQPTHCYDANKISSQLTFVDEDFSKPVEIETLLDTKIEINGKNSVFKINDCIVNLAGVIGNKQTSCSSQTREVIIECAYFNPESIMGKSVKYDVQSEAAHKFERGVDPSNHENILRRFIYLVNEHASIKKLEIFSKNYKDINKTKIKFDINKISDIVGLKISNNKSINIMENLGFSIDGGFVYVPTFRHDISTQNDLAEEIARVIGYDFIPRKSITLPTNKSNVNELQSKIRTYLVEKGFNEVINFPFVSENTSDSIRIDNPLDSNREFLRIKLRDSLLNNLLYNERRQKDSIKLFELSNVYSSTDKLNEKIKLGIIASGRVGKNYKDFSKKIDKKYLLDLLKLIDGGIEFESISRKELNSKAKSDIFYVEMDLSDIPQNFSEYDKNFTVYKKFNKYQNISELPSSLRDISFSLSDSTKSSELQDKIFKYKNKILKDVYIFDFYFNADKNELKIGFRFIFQSNNKTLTDIEVDGVMQDIFKEAFKIKSVSVPGLN